jgi:hypothetical protein
MISISLWPAVLETLRALGAQYDSNMNQAAADLGLSEWNRWLLPAIMFEPEPISATRLRTRSPYTSARLFDERLAKAARQGFLTPDRMDDGEYRLTEMGKQAANHLLEAMHTKIATLHPISSSELERLASLLYRLVMACLTAPEPPAKWYILHSRRLDPGDNAQR